MNNYKEVNLNGIRQTYIIMYEQDGIRYIFNRSIPWSVYLSFKKLKRLINIIGENAILKFLDRFDVMKEEINYLTRTFVLDTTKFTILEIHSEWQNYKRCNQIDIEERKTELCIEYNAIKRASSGMDIKVDSCIAKMIQKEFKLWLADIYDEIASYSKLIKEDIVRTTLGTTVESLKEEKERLENQIDCRKRILDKYNKDILENKKTLARQNYIIDKYYQQYVFTPTEHEYIDGKINNI